MVFNFVNLMLLWLTKLKIWNFILCSCLLIELESICRWHDAGTYDAVTKTGGPNGSIRNREEHTHGANAGLKFAIDLCGKFSLKLYLILICMHG